MSAGEERNRIVEKILPSGREIKIVKGYNLKDHWRIACLGGCGAMVQKRYGAVCRKCRRKNRRKIAKMDYRLRRASDVV